jgi:hypothetical protein
MDSHSIQSNTSMHIIIMIQRQQESPAASAIRPESVAVTSRSGAHVRIITVYAKSTIVL